MNRFQKLNFSNVEEFLDYLPSAQLAIVQRLRDLIAETFPNYREKLAYNVPFYYNNNRICFIWPAAIPWGNLSQGVALGFERAKHLDPEQHFLKYNGRKTIGRMVIRNIEELNEDKLDSVKLLLQEAYLLDID